MITTSAMSSKKRMAMLYEEAAKKKLAPATRLVETLNPVFAWGGAHGLVSFTKCFDNIT